MYWTNYKDPSVQYRHSAHNAVPSLLTNLSNMTLKLKGLSRRSAAARHLRLRVRIPQETWKSVYCAYCVLSDTGLCEELIIRPE
jgi:hypothetical protein